MPPKKVEIRCLLCNCNTLEEMLEIHIQYNHMIYTQSILKALYNLHYPPVSRDNFESVLQEGKKPNQPKGKSFPPKSPLKRGKNDEGKSPKKLKKSNAAAAANSSGTTDKYEGKKPVKLKAATPLRKRLHPNKEQVLDDEVGEDGGKTSVEYDDVYTRVESDKEQQRNIKKIRQLQTNDLLTTFEQGTYIQCCEPDCKKWRVVREFQDPATVPDFWVCSMNKNEVENTCSKGSGYLLDSDDEEQVDVEFALGSLVWAKFPGYPWWPGMVDYCPIEEDTFLVDLDVNPAVAAHYHVVFFDKEQNVARCWMKKEDVSKFTNPGQPPAKPNFKNEAVRKRYIIATKMAEEAHAVDLIERVEKFSFAALYTGRWKDSGRDPIDEADSLERLSPEIEVDPRLVGLTCFQAAPDKDKSAGQDGQTVVHTRKKRTFLSKKKKRGVLWSESAVDPTFNCIICSKPIKAVRKLFENHLRKHKLNLTSYLEGIDDTTLARNEQEDLNRIRQWVATDLYFQEIGDEAKKRTRSGEEVATIIRRRLSTKSPEHTPGIVAEPETANLRPPTDGTSANISAQNSASTAEPEVLSTSTSGVTSFKSA